VKLTFLQAELKKLQGIQNAKKIAIPGMLGPVDLEKYQ
jgi:hypothetical protein